MYSPTHDKSSGEIMIFKVLNYSINPEFSGVQIWGKPWTTPKKGTATSAAPGVWDNIPDVLDTSGPEQS